MSDPRNVLSRPAAEPHRTASYGDDVEHVVDLWFPKARGPHPVVVLIHGGFWRSEYDRLHTRPMSDALTRSGYLVCAVEYRRTGQPGGGWPGTFDDLRAAMDALPWILGEDADFGRIALVGHSAGAHLALWASSEGSWGSQRVRGVVSLAGVCDLELASRLQLDDNAVGALLGGTPLSVPDRYTFADPIRLAPTGVRTVLLHGDADDVVPLDASVNYAAAAGPECELRALAGTGHFSLIDPLSSVWPEVLRALEEVLA